MKYLKYFDSVQGLQEAIQGSPINFMGLAYQGNTPQMYINIAAPTPAGPDFNGHDYVDLGIVSNGHKLYFATKNVGADTITSYGGYYAWGETSTKTNYDGSHYTWGSYPYYTKYNGSDNKTTLDLTDDVAHVVMGGDWRMPTDSEVTMLLELKNKEWVNNYQQSGVNGILFTVNNNTLFIPAAGYIIEDTLSQNGEYVGIRTNKLYTETPDEYNYAYNMYYQTYQGSSWGNVAYLDRESGYSVRGVIEGPTGS